MSLERAGESRWGWRLQWGPTQYPGVKMQGKTYQRDVGWQPPAGNQLEEVARCLKRLPVPGNQPIAHTACWNHYLSSGGHRATSVSLSNQGEECNFTPWGKEFLVCSPSPSTSPSNWESVVMSEVRWAGPAARLYVLLKYLAKATAREKREVP